MFLWNAVVERVVKNGVVVKDMQSPSSTLVPFDVQKIALIDMDSMAIHPRNDEKWIAEPSDALCGRRLTLVFKDDQATEIKFAGFRGEYDIKHDDITQADPYAHEMIVIYHDFNGEDKKGTSGKKFAESVKAYQESLGGVAHLVHANSTYPGLLEKLQKISDTSKENVYGVLIATHGSPGQLWVGDPESITYESVVAAPVSGKNFIAPSAFGLQLMQLFGPGLAVSILSCYFSHGEEGIIAAQAIRSAANARALYAGNGEVFFNCGSSGSRPTVTCVGAVAIYEEDQVKVKGGQIPVFGI